MDNHTATEQAYKNGYREGVKAFSNYLKKHSCFYDLDSYHSFRAIDIDDLDELIENFLRGEII